MHKYNPATQIASPSALAALSTFAARRQILLEPLFFSLIYGYPELPQASPPFIPYTMYGPDLRGKNNTCFTQCQSPEEHNVRGHVTDFDEKFQALVFLFRNSTMSGFLPVFLAGVFRPLYKVLCVNLRLKRLCFLN